MNMAVLNAMLRAGDDRYLLRTRAKVDGVCSCGLRLHVLIEFRVH